MLLGADHIENVASPILLHVEKCLLSRCLAIFDKIFYNILIPHLAFLNALCLPYETDMFYSICYCMSFLTK
jgi:hypothetical protein